MLIVVLGLGVITGLTTFITALIMGQGLLIALSLYMASGIFASLIGGLALYAKCTFQRAPETQLSF